jgi:hypothetical protein
MSYQQHSQQPLSPPSSTSLPEHWQFVPPPTDGPNTRARRANGQMPFSGTAAPLPVEVASRGPVGEQEGGGESKQVEEWNAWEETPGGQQVRLLPHPPSEQLLTLLYGSTGTLPARQRRKGRLSSPSTLPSTSTRRRSCPFRTAPPLPSLRSTLPTPTTLPLPPLLLKSQTAASSPLPPSSTMALLPLRLFSHRPSRRVRPPPVLRPVPTLSRLGWE